MTARPGEEEAETKVAQMPSTTRVSAAVISWPGYGIMFFWQLGVLSHLQEHFDLSRCAMVGSSAGGLLSILSACRVRPEAALELAHQLCIEHGVYRRPLGLLGVWGGIVRTWLDRLLPPDAAELCSGGHVALVITTLPLLRRRVISSFKDRRDLIDVALASAHVPLMLDWQLSAACRGSRCVDGSLLYMITRRCHALKPAAAAGAPPLLLFDPLSDRQLFASSWQLLRCLLVCGKRGAEALLQQGAAYAQRLDRAGGLAALEGCRRRSVLPAAGQEAAQQLPATLAATPAVKLPGDADAHVEVAQPGQPGKGEGPVAVAVVAEVVVRCGGNGSAKGDGISCGVVKVLA